MRSRGGGWSLCIGGRGDVRLRRNRFWIGAGINDRSYPISSCYFPSCYGNWWIFGWSLFLNSNRGGACFLSVGRERGGGEGTTLRDCCCCDDTSGKITTDYKVIKIDEHVNIELYVQM